MSRLSRHSLSSVDMAEFIKDLLPENTVPENIIFSGRYEDTEAIKCLVIPEGIVEICDNAFRDFVHLETVELPSTLKKISACAFSGCKNLKSVKFKKGVEEIPASALVRALSRAVLP